MFEILNSLHVHKHLSIYLDGQSFGEEDLALSYATLANVCRCTASKKLFLTKYSVKRELCVPLCLFHQGVLVKNPNAIRLLSLRVSQSFVQEVGYLFALRRTSIFTMTFEWLTELKPGKNYEFMPLMLDILAVCAHGTGANGSISEILIWLYDNYKMRNDVVASIFRAFGVMASGLNGRKVAAAVIHNHLLQDLLETLFSGGELERTAMVALWSVLHNSERARSLCKTLLDKSKISLWLDRGCGDIISQRVRIILKSLF